MGDKAPEIECVGRDKWTGLESRPSGHLCVVGLAIHALLVRALGTLQSKVVCFLREVDVKGLWEGRRVKTVAALLPLPNEILIRMAKETILGSSSVPRAIA